MDYIRKNEKDFAPFMDDETVEKYCRRMEKDSTWGGQVEINALGHRFEFNFIIHQVGAPNLV